MLCGVQSGFATAKDGLGVMSGVTLATVPLAGTLPMGDADAAGACLARAAPGWALGFRTVMSGLWTTAAAAGPRSNAREKMCICSLGVCMR